MNNDKIADNNSVHFSLLFVICFFLRVPLWFFLVYAYTGFFLIKSAISSAMPNARAVTVSAQP